MTTVDITTYDLIRVLAGTNFALRLRLYSGATGLPMSLPGRAASNDFSQAHPVLREAFTNQDFDTGDSDLDDLLNKSIFKFLDPNPGTRREALDHLWDAWERLKTLDGPGDKAALTKAMLEATAGPDSPKFGEALDKDAIGLTWVGNNLRIRHSETDKERLARNEHVDYLFHRMFSLIQMILSLR